MLRGRHRGLPVAIDRAVMLPSEFGNVEGQSEDGQSERHNSTTGVGHNGEVYHEKRSPQDALLRRSWRSDSVDSGRQRTSRVIEPDSQTTT